MYIKIRVQPRWPFQFKNQFILPNLTLKIKSQPPHTVGPCAVQNPIGSTLLYINTGTEPVCKQFSPSSISREDNWSVSMLVSFQKKVEKADAWIVAFIVYT